MTKSYIAYARAELVKAGYRLDKVPYGYAIVEDVPGGRTFKIATASHKLVSAFVDGFLSGLDAASPNPGRKVREAPTGRKVFASHERHGHLTTSGRRALPRSDFALPPGLGEKRRGIKGRLPIEDAAHARAALSRASEMHNRGEITKGQLQAVRGKVQKRYPEIDVSMNPPSTRDLVAAYLGDGYLYGASGDPGAADPHYWLALRLEGEPYSLYRLHGVPFGLATKLEMQGTSEQEFEDGYVAAMEAAPYADGDPFYEYEAGADFQRVRKIDRRSRHARPNPPDDRGHLQGDPLEIKYRHAEDGKYYVHTFGKGDELRTMPDGSLRIANPDRSLWRDFP